MRTDGRMNDELRPIAIQRDYTCYADGSVLIEVGRTRVICTAMVESGVPRHCQGRNMGWLTAEYCMLPSANPQRRSLQGRPSSRSLEIQRLIGRSLRAAVDLTQLTGNTLWVDCDVIQADGGTRTASITGAFVAVVDALWKMKEDERIACVPLLQGVCAVSVGIVEGQPLVDLNADEDRAAAVDMNVVLSHEGRLIEVQGTAERRPFTREEHEAMIELAVGCADRIRDVQAEALGERLVL